MQAPGTSLGSAEQRAVAFGAARLFGRAFGLAGAAIAGALVVVLTAGLLSPPAAERATAALAVDLEVPGEAALPQLDQRSIVYAADGTVLAILHDEVDRVVVPLDQVPDHVVEAVITAEDRKFFEHDGYDIEGMGRALLANARARGIAQGGSTITQQLAKQNFVGNDQTVERKISELLYAVAMEEEFSKDELLERYLNQVYFGAGAYGIAAAAEEFFGVRPDRLTPDQAAVLAGVIRFPGGLNPRTNPDGALARRDAVLRGMRDQGYLTSEEAERLLATPLEVKPQRERDVKQPFFVEAVKREFFASAAFGEERGDRIERLFTGGLHIHTTLDPEMQRAAAEVVDGQFPDGSGPTAAIAAVDPRDGAVRALYGGADFAEEQFDFASQGRRQPGSAFKPFVLAEALEQGFPPSMTLQGSGPMTFRLAGHTQPWTVSNYAGRSYGTVDLERATALSVNTAYAQLINLVGVDEVVDLAGRMGIDIPRGIGTNIGPSLALGALEYGATPLEMASAYGVFANDGQRVAPHVIERVEDSAGEVVYASEATSERVLDEHVNAAVLDMLRAVVESGTGVSARLPDWDTAGKTGTTQNNADAWFVGFTPVLSASVWVGHAEGQVSMPGTTGGSLAAGMWRRFVEQALDGVEPVDYPEPTTTTTISDRTELDVPDVRGMSESEALEALSEAKLIGVTRSEASASSAGTVLWQSPRADDTARVGDTVYLGVSTGTPPAPPPPPPPPQPAPAPAPPPAPEPAPEPPPAPEPAAPAPPAEGPATPPSAEREAPEAGLPAPAEQ